MLFSNVDTHLLHGTASSALCMVYTSVRSCVDGLSRVLVQTSISNGSEVGHEEEQDDDMATHRRVRGRSQAEEDSQVGSKGSSSINGGYGEDGRQRQERKETAWESIVGKEVAGCMTLCEPFIHGVVHVAQKSDS
uniref:Uncharacterized protein n=1 Tax=Vitrella brassicaformis TaxID=1169539 RepID=A0A7S1JUP4_9ALVE|mmetsp:Transcript_25425/g.62966  ORF Transcript_25425/g.62966 Transcript_25425/m.62966 type:complete len:135 (+) Transcript_25425:150-554(+)